MNRPMPSEQAAVPQACPAMETELELGSDATTGDFAQLISMVAARSGINFTRYNHKMMSRRFAHRMKLLGITSPTDYLNFAQSNQAEQDRLQRDFLVNVSQFFRDPSCWSALRDHVIPKLFEHGHQKDAIRVWTAGCATGEEAYSVAMLMEDYCRKHRLTRPFQLFATDVNEDALAVARKGAYDEAVLDQIPLEFQGSNFVQMKAGALTIAPQIRKRIVFSQQNAFEDPPFVKTDLVTCRNLLIYLSPEAQEQALALLSFSLRDNGFLFQGASEHVAGQSPSFVAFHSAARIYQNKRSAEWGTASPTFGLSNRGPDAPPQPDTKVSDPSDQMRDLIDAMLCDLNACSFIVNEQHQILRRFGDWAVHRNRQDSENLFDLFADDLRGLVALQLRSAMEAGEAHIHGVSVTIGGEHKAVDVHCKRNNWGTTKQAFAITIRLSATDQGVEPSLAPDPRIHGLKEVLRLTNQALSAANEALQATNEELSVTNEELHAVNEEHLMNYDGLKAINHENANHIRLLTEENTEIEDLLDTANLGVALLDDQGRIRRFNKSFTTYFQLTEADIGRQLSCFAPIISRDDYAMVLNEIDHVLGVGEDAHRDVQCLDGSWAHVHVRPFRATATSEPGVAVSLVDTTRMNQLTKRVQTQRDQLTALLESEAAGYWDWDIVTGAQYMSPRLKSMFGYRDDELDNLHTTWMGLLHPDDLPKVQAAFDAHANSRGDEPYDIEVRHLHKDGSVVWVICRGHVVEWSPDGQALRMLGVHIDITHLKDRELKIHAEAQDARRFAFATAHDLLQPMTTIERGVLSLLEDAGKADGADHHQILTYLDQAAKRMRARIHGVLDFAQVFNTDQPCDPVDLMPIARHAIDEFRSQIDEIGAEIELQDLSPVMSRASLVPQLFQNLISNALKYRKKRGKCRIVIEPAPSEPGMVAFRVSDNGIGISPEHRADLFQMFTRLHAESEYEGIGVGLALCKRIMTLSGGRIVLADGIEGGTSVICTFPGLPDA